MTLLAEQPLLVSAMLIALAVASAYGWLQTGKRGLIFGTLLALCLIPVAFWIAGVWETDRERIRNVIDEVAAAVEANQHEAAVAYIADEATRASALAELPRYVFSMAQVNSIRDLEITDNVTPVTARAALTVKVDVSEKSGSIQDVRVLRLVTLTLSKSRRNADGELDWVITGYAHAPVVGGPDNYSTDTLP